MTRTKAAQADAAEAVAELRRYVKPGDTLYTVLRHRARSGMSRAIDVYALECGEAGKVSTSWLSHYAARALGWRFSDRHEAVIVDGAGMDMGFHLVYSLSRTLFRDGFTCTGERCPSNAHSNGDRDYTPHHHSDGGYAVRQEWI